MENCNPAYITAEVTGPSLAHLPLGKVGLNHWNVEELSSVQIIVVFHAGALAHRAGLCSRRSGLDAAV